MGKLLHEMELLEMELAGLNIEIEKAVYERDKATSRLGSIKYLYRNDGLGDIGHEKLNKYYRDREECNERLAYLRRRHYLVRERLTLLNMRYNEEIFGLFYKSDIGDLCYHTFW